MRGHTRAVVGVPEGLPGGAACLGAAADASGDAQEAVGVVGLVGLVGLFPVAGAGRHGAGVSKKEAPHDGGAGGLFAGRLLDVVGGLDGTDSVVGHRFIFVYLIRIIRFESRCRPALRTNEKSRSRRVVWGVDRYHAAWTAIDYLRSRNALKKCWGEMGGFIRSF